MWSTSQGCKAADVFYESYVRYRGQLLAMSSARYCPERTPRFPELWVALKFRLNAMAPMTDYTSLQILPRTMTENQVLLMVCCANRSHGLRITIAHSDRHYSGGLLVSVAQLPHPSIFVLRRTQQQIGQRPLKDVVQANSSHFLKTRGPTEDDTPETRQHRLVRVLQVLASPLPASRHL
jgi:hypothetical protein